MDISSYSGFYKDNYLRSSYEYVYVKYLEKINLRYKVEEIKYTLSNEEIYTPDFFIYGNNNNLIQITEVKSTHKRRIKKAKNKVKLLSTKINTPIVLILKKDLEKLCSIFNLDFNMLRKEWKEKEDVNKKNIMKGKLNPMYGKKHSEETKRKIGKKTKERASNPEYIEKLSNSLKEFYDNVEDTSIYGVDKKPRVYVKCEICKSKFKIIEGQDRVVCSVKCASKKGSIVAGKLKKQRVDKRNEQMKKEVIEIIKDNKDFIQQIPFNNIKSNLMKLFKSTLNKYDLKDFRNISYAFYGKYSFSLKKLLKDFIKISKTN